MNSRIALWVGGWAVSLATIASGESRSVYFIGSSTIDQINYNGLKSIAQSRQHQHTWGRHMIPGASLDWIWNRGPDSNGDGVPGDYSGFTESPYGHYFTALPNFEWSNVVLTPVDRHLGSDSDYGARFINLARTNPANHDTQHYIFSRWPRNEPTNNNLPKIASGPHAGQLDYRAQWLRPYNLNQWNNSYWTRDYYQRLTDKLNADLPGMSPPVRLVPVGDVLFALNDRMRAGEFAAWGMDDILDIYEDGSHFTNVGQYIVGLTFYATMYADNPEGSAVPALYGPRSGKPLDKAISPELAAQLQKTVWQVVSTHSYAGIPEPSGPIALVAVASLGLMRPRRR
jgi:hypothetical protein